MRFVQYLAAGSLLASQWAFATQLVTNGGFESGLTGWTVTNRAGGSGSWFAASGMTAPGSGLGTVGPFAGSGYALTDQDGPGTHALTQSFVVASGASQVLLTFKMFVNNYGGVPVTNGGVLDDTKGPIEFGRVDLLTAGASAFDTGAGVISNFFTGSDAGANPHPYTSYNFDITNLVSSGGTFQLRFAESDNRGNFSMGVDNVSIDAVTTAVPEPGTIALFGLGLFAIASRLKRNQL